MISLQTEDLKSYKAFIVDWYTIKVDKHDTELINELRKADEETINFRISANVALTKLILHIPRGEEKRLREMIEEELRKPPTHPKSKAKRERDNKPFFKWLIPFLSNPCYYANKELFDKETQDDLIEAQEKKNQ